MYSVCDLFKIGIGPSSSHTVGPMRAAARFSAEVLRLAVPATVVVELYGSLALTGRGHATDRAIILGLAGYQPDSVPSEIVQTLPERVLSNGLLPLNNGQEIPWIDGVHLIWKTNDFLPRHPNGIQFSAWDSAGQLLLQDRYYSVGGGFVVNEAEAGAGNAGEVPPSKPLLYPFTSATELLRLCQIHHKKIWQLVYANENSWRSESETKQRLEAIWQVMRDSIERGCRTEGELPGGLHVRRRAAGIRRRLEDESHADGLEAIDWLSMFALAVNEENAAGHRVVTAPTNGAAGVIPAVIAYYERFVDDASPEGIRQFLLTATAIGALYKRNASLSAAEVGCQGEVGVASSMAAAGLAEVLGGTNEQIENAAEIAMEHHLGMTCDPIGGLVQVPCIERNAIGAVKAVNAARLAVRYGDGTHRVSLDRVIETMRQTGIDMANKYKETSLGGLAVTVGLPEC